MPEMKAPAPAPISVAGTLAFIASRRWKGGIVMVGVVVGGWGSDIFFPISVSPLVWAGVWCGVFGVFRGRLRGFEVAGRERSIVGRLGGVCGLVSRLT